MALLTICFFHLLTLLLLILSARVIYFHAYKLVVQKKLQYCQRVTEIQLWEWTYKRGWKQNSAQSQTICNWILRPKHYNEQRERNKQDHLFYLIISKTPRLHVIITGEDFHTECVPENAQAYFFIAHPLPAYQLHDTKCIELWEIPQGFQQHNLLTFLCSVLGIVCWMYWFK